MTLTLRLLPVIFFIAILYMHAFSQGNDSALSLYRSGESFIDKNPDKAFELLKKAMDISEEKKQWDVYLKSVNKLGSFTLKEDKYREQVFVWLKHAFTTLDAHAKDDQVAQLHFHIAEFYNRITIEIDSPIYHYQEAKKIWTSLKGETSVEVSNCYHGLGNIYKYYKFDFHEAEKCYEKALSIRERLGFDDAEILYKNYYGLAATNRSQFDYEKALSYGVKTLEIAKKLKAKRRIALTELAHGMVANIYRDMRNSDLAKKHYLDALALNETTKDYESRAWYYSCIGETFKKDTMYDKALQYFSKAYTIYKSPDVKDPDLFMNLLIAMMDTYSRSGELQKFSNIRGEIFRELSSLGKLKSREASEAWRYVGDHHLRDINYDSAIFCYQKALNASIISFNSIDPFVNPSESEIGLNYYDIEILIQKASVLRKKFDLNGQQQFLQHSLSCLRLAERLLSLQRNSLDLENAKWEFLDANYDMYENILSGLYEGRKTLFSDSITHLAFQYFERSKARSLADAITEAEFTSQITSDDSLFRILNELKRELFKTQDLIDQESQKSNNITKVSELRETVVTLDRKIHDCKLAIEEKHPGYFRAKYGFQNVSLNEIQSMMKEKHKVLLEYFWGRTYIYAIGISGEHVVLKKIGSTDSVKVIVEKLLRHLATQQSSMNPDIYESFAVSARALHMILVEPFSELLFGKKRLQIIPDGALTQIPFEILIEQDPDLKQVNYKALKYLIKSYSIGYAYAAPMLNPKNNLSPRSEPSLLAVGFAGGKKPGRSVAELNIIEGTKHELNALKKRFNGGKFLTGETATELNFKTLAPEFDIIHLAIHGVGDTQKDFASTLYFSSALDEEEDGELHAYELYGLKLNAIMAVLSSCESGLGKGYKGEGMISMASAFTYSGCENILMSLWKVNDQTSTKLTDEFYNFLVNGETISDALRMAKLNYLESADELTADPKIWAPLVAYGSLDEIFPNDRNKIIRFAWLLLIVPILFLSFKIFRR